MIAFDDVLRRLLLFARALGFVFLVYFLPVVLRDVAGFLLPAAQWIELITGDPPGVGSPLFAVVLSFALSVGAVAMHARAHGDRARPLLSTEPAWWGEWGRGVLFGMACASAAALPALLSGAIRVVSLRAVGRPDLLVAAVFVITVEAAREELGFRGPSQRDLAGAVGFPVAAVFLSASFALVHAANPAVGPRAMLAIFFAGLALAGVVRARGDLGMACGLHAGWNVAGAFGWSLPVSGMQASTRLLEVQSSESSFWTGGSFGVEASVPGLVVLAVLGLVAWRLPARSGPNGAAGEPPAPAESDRGAP